MKKLFTNDVIIEKQFLGPDVCKEWEKTILSNLKVFGSDVEPSYGDLAAYYGMIEAGLNESYYRYADSHNKLLGKMFPQIDSIIQRIGMQIFTKSKLPTNALPIVPRDAKYFLKAGFNIQLATWDMYNIHTDTEGLIQYPESIFNKNTRAYSAVISIKRTSQYTKQCGGDLDVWKERYTADELDAFYKADGCTAHSIKNRIHIPYEVGTLALFDSFMPHVVIPFEVNKKDDRRITFVVHFNYRDRTEKNPFPHLEYWY